LVSTKQGSDIFTVPTKSPLLFNNHYPLTVVGDGTAILILLLVMQYAEEDMEATLGKVCWGVAAPVTKGQKLW